MAAEFTGRYLLDRAPLPALALADNTAAVTAIANDYGFDQVFARQVRAFGGDGGAAIALSTSGASANVLEGLRAARELGLLTIGVTGERRRGADARAVRSPAHDPGRADAADPGGHDAGAAHDLRAGRAQPVRRMSGRAAFLDRDGTINEKAPEGDYITTPERFRFLDGAEQAVRMLAGDGWRVVVVTNQRGVALGRMTLDDVDRVNARMAHLPIAGVFVCPHERDSCDCRKPGTGLFEQARAGFPEIEFAAVGGDRRRRVGHAGRPGDRRPHVPGRPAAAAVAAGRRPEHRLRHRRVTSAPNPNERPSPTRHLYGVKHRPGRRSNICAACLTDVTTAVTPIWLERSVAPESGV